MKTLSVSEIVRSKLEPAANTVHPLEDALAVSTAISLKRLADFICGCPDRPDSIEYIINALDNLHRSRE